MRPLKLTRTAFEDSEATVFFVNPKKIVTFWQNESDTSLRIEGNGLPLHVRETPSEICEQLLKIEDEEKA